METIVIIVFKIWFVASVVYVIFFASWQGFSHRWDIFRIISTYHLFTSTPPYLKLYYRDKCTDESITRWQEISLVLPRKIRHALWFPESTTSNQISSYIDDLLRMSQETTKKKSLSKGFIYKTIMRFIGQYPKTADAKARQFKIEEANGHIATELGKTVFTSDFHDL